MFGASNMVAGFLIALNQNHYDAIIRLIRLDEDLTSDLLWILTRRSDEDYAGSFYTLKPTLQLSLFHLVAELLVDAFLKLVDAPFEVFLCRITPQISIVERETAKAPIHCPRRGIGDHLRGSG